MSWHKRNCNIDYFKIIDTEDKAYWLGFIFADGCISDDHKQLIISLQPSDIQHLEMFNKCIESDYPIMYMDNNRYITLRISRKDFVKHLIDKGCVPRKSLILQFPSEDKLPTHLIKHFIRGYFDGDGCLHAKFIKRWNKPNPYLSCEVNFLGTYDMLQNISKFVPVEFSKIRQDGKIYKMRLTSKSKIIELLDYLYQDSYFYLKRKHDKYVNIIKKCNTYNDFLLITQNPVTITEL